MWLEARLLASSQQIWRLSIALNGTFSRNWVISLQLFVMLSANVDTVYLQILGGRIASKC